MDLVELLNGGDLRSIGRVAEVVAWANTPAHFTKLIMLFEHTERLIAMRAADAAEKVSAQHPEWLQLNNSSILALMGNPDLHIEIKWHLAQMARRITWSEKEAKQVWQYLTLWLLNAGESKIARVNALEACFALARNHSFLEPALQSALTDLHKAPLPPSILARLRKISKTLG